MIRKADIDRLESFRSGKADLKEIEHIYTLFSEKEGDKDFKKYFFERFNESLTDDSVEEYNLTYLLDRIHHSINRSDNHRKQTVIKKLYRWYSVAAAILLIPILLAGGIWLADSNLIHDSETPTVTTLVSPLGARMGFTLPDGTEGWLNSGSSIEYRVPFKRNRQIAVSGEVWFDVAHDSEHPFEVIAGESKIKVLGTKFNVSSYADEKYLEVVLEEGKVEFSNDKLASEIIMKPDERLKLSEGSLDVEITDASKYSAWKEGKLVFRGDSMGEVARRIGRWYNVDVILVDQELEEYSFRGIFQDDSLDEVLQFLRMTSPIKYEIVERQQSKDGMVAKKKVLLTKCNN